MASLGKLIFDNGSISVEMTAVEYNPDFQGETTVEDGYLSPSIKTEAQRYSFEAFTNDGDLLKFDELRTIKQSQFSPSGQSIPITCEDFNVSAGSVIRTGLLTQVTFVTPVMTTGKPGRVSGGIRVRFTEIERNY